MIVGQDEVVYGTNRLKFDSTRAQNMYTNKGMNWRSEWIMYGIMYGEEACDWVPSKMGWIQTFGWIWWSKWMSGNFFNGAFAKVVELWWNNLSWKMALLRCQLVLPLPYGLEEPHCRVKECVSMFLEKSQPRRNLCVG
jgi:hypothetical protein